MWNLEGRTAIVTGAANGIGSATALMMAREGIRVVAVDIDRAALEELRGRIAGAGGEVEAAVADVSDSAAVEQVVQTAQQRFGTPDILFANAAIQLARPAGETSEEDWDRLHAVNLKGVFLCCRAVLPGMRANKSGSIVISSSGHAFGTYPNFSAYASTKGALVAFMRGVALDYAADGIRANCVIPGATDTRLIQDYFAQSADPANARASLLDSIPLGRLAAPEDIGKAVLFLASAHASYITGTTLAVDGGLMARG
ncbi:MAG TPA: SDR family NAD(P)-dependent oxidoreductase [Bryobacteraceae bacterium]|jgi:NAD(P)-dependent dehydrogenase (short-subunit alcohol dehydrogenase family)|nr:SDR family NAD(P)-dependent oxidoreductase [Bryobacteraceae bacterium]